MIAVRYADDLVVGFEHRTDAERFLSEFQERLAKFGLELHPQKTRLIEFGRYARKNRQTRGEGEPESFTFLGFTHHCGNNSRGHFTIWRYTARHRLEAKLQHVKQTLRTRMHEPVAEVGEWIRRVLNGFYQYHAVPGNWAAPATLSDSDRSLLAANARKAQPTGTTHRGAGRSILSTLASPAPAGAPLPRGPL